MLAEAERQVRYANPVSQAMADVMVGQIPGSGLVDAGKDFAQAYQQAGQGNLWSAAGSAAMGVFGAVTELPGAKQIKGIFKGGKAVDKLGDVKKVYFSVGFDGELPQGLQFSDRPEDVVRKVCSYPVTGKADVLTGYFVWKLPEYILHVGFSVMEQLVNRIRIAAHPY